MWDSNFVLTTWTLYGKHISLYIIHDTHALKTHEHQMKTHFLIHYTWKTCTCNTWTVYEKTYFIIYYTRNPCTQHLDAIWKTYFIIRYIWSTCTRNTWSVHGKHISIIHYAWKHQTDKYTFRFQIISTSNFNIDPGLYIMTYCFLIQAIQRHVCMVAYCHSFSKMNGTPNSNR